MSRKSNSGTKKQLKKLKKKFFGECTLCKIVKIYSLAVILIALIFAGISYLMIQNNWFTISVDEFAEREEVTEEAAHGAAEGEEFLATKNVELRKSEDHKDRYFSGGEEDVLVGKFVMSSNEMDAYLKEVAFTGNDSASKLFSGVDLFVDGEFVGNLRRKKSGLRG